MNLSLNQEQKLLRDSVARFLSAKYDFTARRQRLVASQGFDPEIWNSFATLGLLGAALPEDVGGSGGGSVETMLIMEEMGEALVTEPYLETAVIGGGILRQAGGSVGTELLAEIPGGNVRIALAALEIGSLFNLQSVRTEARETREGWIISGVKPVVACAPCATHLLVTARTSGTADDPKGISLFIVEADAPGIRKHSYGLIDGRLAADLVFDEVTLGTTALLGSPGKALQLLDPVMDQATAAVCAEAVGLMRRMLAATVEYTKQRKQFGQPLASFQALQHRMVDMYMALEQSVSALYLATLGLDKDAARRRKAVSAAKVTVGRSLRMVGQNAVQLHGAMGMTDEIAVGHYFKRGTVIEQAFGSVDFHMTRYATADVVLAA